MGIENICAVDGNAKRLDFAKKMGAEVSVDFTQYKGVEALAEAVKEAQGGHLADFAFQCTGNPKAHIGPNLVITQIGIGKMRMPRITVENKQ